MRNKYWLVLILYSLSLPLLLSQDNTIYDTDAGPGNSGDKVSFFGTASGQNNSGNAVSIFGARQDTTGVNQGDSIAAFGHTERFINRGDFNVMFGQGSARNNLLGHSNCFIGGSSGFMNAEGNFNTFLGYKVGYYAYDQSRNTLINRVLIKNNGLDSASDNTIVGFEAGAMNTSGELNTFIGAWSGHANLSGDKNTFIGYYAGFRNKVGHSNSIVGNGSGSFLLGSENTFVGIGSGGNCVNCFKNTMIGQDAGRFMDEGNNNTLAGSGAGKNSKGDLNIRIGNNFDADCSDPGCLDVNNQTLYIDKTESDHPLIYGNFSDDHVVINGELEVTYTLSEDSDVHVKTNFDVIDESDILQKVKDLPISKWSYKHAQNSRHIGPMAQDFQKAFQLSDNERSIALVDMDGIKLAAIKALALEQKSNEEALNSLKDTQVRARKILADIERLEEQAYQYLEN